MTKSFKFLIALILLFSISSCSLYEEVEMLGIQSYDVGAPANNEVKASIVVKVNNPNFYSINFKKSMFDVYVDDELLGKAQMAEDVKILKKTENDYTLELLLQKSDIEKAAISLVRKAFTKKTISLRVKGKAKCKVWGILGKKIDVDETKKISLMEFINKFK